MIHSGEIQKIASQGRLRDTQIEKDYINAWILRGISANDYLKDHIIFKGGTLLRKVYYSDYRLSEDLDFTFQGKEFDIQIIKEEFSKLFDWVYEEARIRLEMKNDNEYETGNFNFYISYIGPLGGVGANKSVKVDISSSEVIINEPARQNTVEDYSDLEDYIFTFQDKAKHKGLDPDNLADKLNEKEDIYKKLWETHLSHQINDLPDFEDVWRDLGKHWRKFTSFIEK